MRSGSAAGRREGIRIGSNTTQSVFGTVRSRSAGVGISHENNRRDRGPLRLGPPGSPKLLTRLLGTRRRRNQGIPQPMPGTD